MPYYQLKNQETGEIKAVRRMDKTLSELLNQNRPNNENDGFLWIRGLEQDSKSNPTNSLTKVLRGLDTEGFSEYHYNIIEKFWARDAYQALKRQEFYNNAKEKFIKYMKDQPPEVRSAIGRFMSLRAGKSFDAGVRIGLSGRLVEEEGGNDDFSNFNYDENSGENEYILNDVLEIKDFKGSINCE